MKIYKIFGIFVVGDILKRLFLIIICFYLVIFFCGCNNKENNTESQRKEVVINMPSDDTVGGYRTESGTNSKPTDRIDADNVTVLTPSAISSSTQNENQTAKQTGYYANLKSKVFHKVDCGSVKNMKEENRFYTKDKNFLTEKGYTPCKSCKP